MLVVLIIVKQGGDDAQDVLEFKRVTCDKDGGMLVQPYMEGFLVPFYVVVKDKRMLPQVMAQALIHWIELS